MTQPTREEFHKAISQKIAYRKKCERLEAENEKLKADMAMQDLVYSMVAECPRTPGHSFWVACAISTVAMTIALAAGAWWLIG